MPMLFQKKERILIFGASSGGVNFYNSQRRRYQVLGFIDNDTKKQGQHLLGHLIYGPGELNQLGFDKIIIASDYFDAIFPQLLELGISNTRIDVYHPGTRGSSLIRRLRSLSWIVLLELICRRPGWLSDVLYRYYITRATWLKKKVKRCNLQWLDTTDEFKVHVFRTTAPAHVQGPRFVGEHVAAVRVSLPEVALHRFRQGQVGSVSRSVLLPDQRVVIERVTTAKPRIADYSVGDMLFHGERLALVAVGDVEYIDKGLLINGVSEGNYYHWVVELLSHLQFIEELPAQYADYPILIPAKSQAIPSIKAMIDSFDIGRPFIYLATQSRYQVDDLLWISAANNLISNFKASNGYTTESHFARPESIQYLREHLLSLAEGAATTNLPTRVFLARKGFLRRYNQQEVIDALEPYGFTSVYMEDLNIHQQVTIMANAEVVLGPTGAAWTNIMFASASTQALCWMAEEYRDLACFSNLAAIAGIDMEFLRYKTGAQNSNELYYKDYTLDIAGVSSWLKRHLPDPLQPTKADMTH